jgi:FkbM family methyltransferase
MLERLEHTFKRERRRVKSGLAAVGIRVGPQWNDPHWRRGEILRRYGVTLVLDVGANIGQYALGLRRDGGYRGRILSFEPISAVYEALVRATANDPKWECVPLALSDQDGTAEITVASTSDSSSFLCFKDTSLSAAPGAFPVATESVQTARLDSLSPLTPADVVLLKLDVQGFEPRVLAGADATLARISLLECELVFEHLYEGQPTFREMVELIDDLGFRPISVAPGNVNYRTASLAYVDMIFARPSPTVGPA